MSVKARVKKGIMDRNVEFQSSLFKCFCCFTVNFRSLFQRANEFNMIKVFTTKQNKTKWIKPHLVISYHRKQHLVFWPSSFLSRYFVYLDSQKLRLESALFYFFKKRVNSFGFGPMISKVEESGICVALPQTFNSAHFSGPFQACHIPSVFLREIFSEKIWKNAYYN